MSDTNDLRYRINSLERDLAEYQDALEQHLYDTELERVQRSHGWLNAIGFLGSMWAAIAIAKWLNFDIWAVDALIGLVAFFAIFATFVAMTDKPLKNEINKIRKPLAWLPKPRWRQNND